MFNRFCFGALLLVGLAGLITGCSTTSSPTDLTTIVISPGSSSGSTSSGGVTFQLAPQGIAQGHAQFTAIGYYGHAGHQITKDIPDSVTWTSSQTQIVGICSNGSSAPCTPAMDGLATVTGFTTNSAGTVAWYGSSNITASAPGFNGTIVSNTAVFNVTACTLCGGGNTDITAISVVPATQTVSSSGVPVQYEAIGTDASGSTLALTSGYAQATNSSIQWVSSNPTVASFADPTNGTAVTGVAGTTTISETWINQDGTAALGSGLLTVTSTTGSKEPIVSVSVQPGAQTVMSIGAVSDFLAIATTNTGTSVDLTNTTATVGGYTIPAAVWKSSNSSVVMIDQATGVATSKGAGAAVITAEVTNPTDGSLVYGQANYTVTVSGTSSSEPVVSLAVLPATQTSLASGQNINFLAIANTGSGSSVNVTSSAVTVNGQTYNPVVWSSSNPLVASVGQNTGIAVSGVAGATAITAIYTNPDFTVVTASALLTVTVPTTTEPYVSLSIVPAAQTLNAKGQTAKFLAIGTTGTGATADLTSYATWSTSNSSVATIVPTAGNATAGIATAAGNGVTAITATVLNSAINKITTDTTSVTASAALTVNITAGSSEPLLSIAIVPGSQSVAVPGQSSQLLAIGTFSAVPTTQDVTAGIASYPITTTWSSSDTSVATVTTTCPAAASTTALSCTISLCPSGSTGATCTTCPTGMVAAGASCATVNPTTPPGLVTGVSQGAAAILAVSSNSDNTLVTATASFTVVGGSAETYTALQIIPATLGVTSPAQQNQFVALATDASGLQFDVTGSVVWKSETPSVATICTNGSSLPCTPATDGLATAGNAGATLITATLKQGLTELVAQANYTLTVGTSPEPLIGLNVVPGAVTVTNKGMTQQYLAFGTYTTIPTLRDITDQVTWISLDPNVASINTNGTPGEVAGLATAQGYEGLAVIYAEGTNPDTTVVVSNPVTFTCQVPGVTPPICSQAVAPSLLATLTVFNAGSNDTNWLITAPSGSQIADNITTCTAATGCLIHCGPGSVTAGYGNSVCTGTYAAGTNVTIIASLAGSALDATFGGWTANCDTTVDVPDMTDACTLPTPSKPIGTGYTTAAGLSTSTTGVGSGAVISITGLAGNLTSCTATTPGSGYFVGDLVYPIQAGATGSSCLVEAVSGAGGVLTMTATMETGGDPSGLVGNQSVGALFYGLTLSCSAVTSGTQNVAFNSGALTASGGTTPYTFSVLVPGTLPAGLTVNAATGAVSGTPTAPGSFSLTATDAHGINAATSCAITINPAP